MFWIIIGTAMLFSCVALGTIAFRGASQLIYPPEPDPEGSPSDYGLPYLEVIFPSRDGLRLFFELATKLGKWWQKRDRSISGLFPRG